MSEGADTISEMLEDFSGGKDKTGTQEARTHLAASCGYLDARLMVYMKETYGLPLSSSSVEGAKRGLKVDRAGLRIELERIGKKPETIESELREVEYFERAAFERMKEERSE